MKKTFLREVAADAASRGDVTGSHLFLLLKRWICVSWPAIFPATVCVVVEAFETHGLLLNDVDDRVKTQCPSFDI